MTIEQGNFFFRFDKDLEDFLKNGTPSLIVDKDIICHKYPSPLHELFETCQFKSEFLQIRKMTFLWDCDILRSKLKKYDITFLIVKICVSLAPLNGVWIIPYKTKDKTRKVKVCYHFPLNSGNSVIYKTYTEKKFEGYLLNPEVVQNNYRCIDKLFKVDEPTALIIDRLAVGSLSFDGYITEIFGSSYNYYQKFER
jgi:hypothetical protein